MNVIEKEIVKCLLN